MTDLEAFTAAYMAACKGRPADWNEIGYWYARQLWDAAIKAEREAIASLAEQSTLRARQTRAWGDAKQVESCEIAAAIRARGDAK